MSSTIEQISTPAAGDQDATHARGDGPLLAVCALCGGAGASTLAYLIARASAQDDEEPVLVCDTGGPTAGLAAYAGLEAPRSLAGAAEALARDEPLSDGLYAQAPGGPRVIARRAELDRNGDEQAVQRLLHDARAAHGLTVVDCGTLARSADRWVLDAATHVAWVLPATQSGVLRGRRLLELVPYDSRRRELVIARDDPGGRRAATSELKRLASDRRGPLVLVPHVPDLAENGLHRALTEASVALHAIQLETMR